MSIVDEMRRERDELIQKLEGEMDKYRKITAQLADEEYKYRKLSEELAKEQDKVKDLQKELVQYHYLLLKEKARTGRVAVRDWWDTDPNDWSAMWQRVIGHPAEVPEETEKEKALILQGIPLCGKALEIGSGVGRLLKSVSPHFASVVGMDASEAYVQMSETYLRDNAGVSVLLTDGLHFPFFDESFSFVFSYTVFQHMPTIGIIRANLREAYRVLASDGYLRFQTVHGNPNPKEHDGWVFASRELLEEEVRNAGFSSIEIEEGLSAPNHFWVTARKNNGGTAECQAAL